MGGRRWLRATEILKEPMDSKLEEEISAIQRIANFRSPKTEISRPKSVVNIPEGEVWYAYGLDFPRKPGSRGERLCVRSEFEAYGLSNTRLYQAVHIVKSIREQFNAMLAEVVFLGYTGKGND